MLDPAVKHAKLQGLTPFVLNSTSLCYIAVPRDKFYLLALSNFETYSIGRKAIKCSIKIPLHYSALHARVS